MGAELKATWKVDPDELARGLQKRRQRGHKDFKYFLKYLLISIVFLGFSNAWSGVYEDFFEAVERDSPGKVLELLLRGFDPNTLNPRGSSALMVAIQEPSPKVLQVLLRLDQVDVNLINRSDESALMLASLKGLEPAVRRLIERGADVNKTGWTPLHYAATGGHIGIMRMLLEHHAFIDPESPNGTTPLMMAARYGSAEAVKLLLEEGAVPTARNRLGLSALDFACIGERPDAIAMLAPLMPGQPGLRDKRIDREAACAKPGAAAAPPTASPGAARAVGSAAGPAGAAPTVGRAASGAAAASEAPPSLRRDASSRSSPQAPEKAPADSPGKPAGPRW